MENYGFPPEQGNEKEEYTDEVVDDQFNELMDRVSNAESDNVKLNRALTSMSAERRDGNFLHHQISTQELLERLEHFYRGDYEAPDDEGNMVWNKQKDTSLVTFNEFGVTSMMEIVSKYIDKNTVLSYYSEERIYQVMTDLGYELILFLLCNYEKMGMDTYFKKTKFRLIITTTTHIIESTYRRALRGQTMQELNQSKVIGQFGTPDLSPRVAQKRRGGFVDKLLGR